MSNGFLAAAVLALAGAAGPQPQVATLDFTEPGLTRLTGFTTIRLSNASLNSEDRQIFIGPPGEYGERDGLGVACATSETGRCNADWSISFAAPVEALVFSAFHVQPGDSVTVTAFLDGRLLGQAVVERQKTIDLSDLGAIDRLHFDDESAESGIAFGDFRFRTAPLPAALPLLIGAAGALPLLRAGRRRR
ncbi:hypothetical protein [Mangrovicoccus sp. HB161399]|uniref:hypothetical protein n=1 Tax=Mangrovicoccus sp. HB161399 TaxID=2720392 RepID=UPI0015545008|nr:hypothetical protein [Mangrovicoccus sp. HB161399]